MTALFPVALFFGVLMLFILGRVADVMTEQHRQRFGPVGGPLFEILFSEASLTRIIVIGLCALGGSLYVVYNYDAENQRWAFGTMGIVLGYWLR
jgi:hypothetical protein